MNDYRKRYGLGGHVRTTATHTPFGGSRSGRYDYFTVTTFPQTLHIINGEYKQSIYDSEAGAMVDVENPYYIAKRHWDTDSGKYLICSAGDNPMEPKPCAGCSKGLRAGSTNSFTILLMENLHKVPYYKNNQPVLRDGKPVMIDDLCEGRNCKKCASGAEMFFGKRLYWSLSNEHLHQLSSAEDKLRAYCVCGKELQIKAYFCPLCSTTLIDLDSTKMSDAEIINAYQAGMWCPSCKRIVRILESVECSCNNPRPLTIFDVNTKVTRIPDAQNAKNFTLSIEFSKPCSIDTRYKGETGPLDMKDIFTPLPIRNQRELIKYYGPITNVPEDTEEYGS